MVAISPSLVFASSATCDVRRDAGDHLRLASFSINRSPRFVRAYKPNCVSRRVGENHSQARERDLSARISRAHDDHSPMRRNSCGSPPGWRRWFDAMDASWLLHCTHQSKHSRRRISRRYPKHSRNQRNGELHRTYSLDPYI